LLFLTVTVILKNATDANIDDEEGKMLHGSGNWGLGNRDFKKTLEHGSIGTLEHRNMKT
jgi:hypothetical protein